MSLPFAFSNNVAPTGGQLDADLAALGAMGITSTVAVGTNAITLTPNTNQPAISVYVNNALFSFSGSGNSTGNVTLQIGSLSPLPLYLPSGAQASAGTITSGTFYVIVYLAALNSASGGFQIISAIPSANLIPISPATAVGLIVKNDGSVPNTKIDITALSAVLVNSSGSPILANSPNVVIDLTTVGANGMDVGSRPTSGWAYLYLISTGSTLAGLATATSPTAGIPTLPAGYSYTYYCGAMFCDGSKNLMRSRQAGNETQYVVTTATNTPTIPLMAQGPQGTYSFTTPTLVAVSVLNFVPLTAGAIKVSCDSSYKGTGGNLQVAPNANYQGCNNAAGNYSPIDTINTSQVITTYLLLESANIFWAGNNIGCALGCFGWRDIYVKA